MTILNYCFIPNYNLFESRVVVRLREKKGACRVLVGKHEGSLEDRSLRGRVLLK